MHLLFKCNTKPRLSSPLAVIMCQGKPEPSSLFKDTDLASGNFFFYLLCLCEQAALGN